MGFTQFIHWQVAIVIFRCFQPVDIRLRPGDICGLTANFPNQLRFFQPVLLLLFIKNRGEGLIGVLDITAEICNILLLFVGIMDYQRAFTDAGFCRPLGVPTVVGDRQHATGRVGQQVFADCSASAEAVTTVIGGVIGLVMDITPAQRAGNS